MQYLGNNNISSTKEHLGEVNNSFFAMDIEFARIVERFPKTGNPPRGVPLSVTVEVKTSRSIGFALRFPISGGPECPDAKVAIVNNTTDDVLGIAPVKTSTAGLCTGTAKVTLPVDYRPGVDDFVRILVYEETVTDQKIKDGLLPVWESQPIQLGIDQKTAKKSGQIQEASEASIFTAPILKDFNVALKNTGKLATGVLILYLVWLNRDAVTNVSNKISNSLSNR